MTVLITGAGGLLAPYLADSFSDQTVVTCSRNSGHVQCDLADNGQVTSMIAKVQPDTVIHAAAYTDVDGCQQQPDRAFRDNALAVSRLAQTLPETTKLVLISTDQVYGHDNAPHQEHDTAPVNAYGQSKLAGEWAALTRPNSLVLRVNFFGPSRVEGRNSLSDFFINAFTARASVTMFRDVFFSPLHVETLVGIVREMIIRQACGVFNTGCRDGISKAEFGSLVAAGLGVCYEGIKIGDSVDMPNRAPRPRDLRMDVSKMEEFLQRPMSSMEDEIRRLGLGKV